MPELTELQRAISFPNENLEIQRNQLQRIVTSPALRSTIEAARREAGGTTVPDDDWLIFYSGALPLSQAVYERCKRVADVLASLSLLLLLSPLFALISLLIVMDSPGAPIFRQLRKGKNQNPFYIYKFRTMVKNAAQVQSRLIDQNEVDGILFKLKNDPRITRVGRVLRAYSIDELPQLLNVLKGEMSLVGPRPFSLEDFNRSSFDHDVFHRWLAERHHVLPGVTGLWQISGRNDIAFERLMELDLLYIRHQNPIIDAIIIGKTVGVVLKRKGAY